VRPKKLLEKSTAQRLIFRPLILFKIARKIDCGDRQAKLRIAIESEVSESIFSVVQAIVLAEPVRYILG